MQRGADFPEQLFAYRVRVGKHADLDQFMAGKIFVDFIEHGRGQAGVADHDDRMQMVGAGAQRAALCRGQFEDHGGILTDEAQQNQQAMDARARQRRVRAAREAAKATARARPTSCLKSPRATNCSGRGMVVVDLGAAPGGWSQVARAQVGARGPVIALDVLEMEPLPGVDVSAGRFPRGAAAAALAARAGRPQRRPCIKRYVAQYQRYCTERPGACHASG